MRRKLDRSEVIFLLMLIGWYTALVLETRIPFAVVALIPTLYLCILIAAQYGRPERVEFPGLRTFRDLALAIGTLNSILKQAGLK